MYKDNLKEILTLGVFDYDAAVNILTTGYSESDIKRIPPAPTLTKPIFDDGRGRYRMSACAKEWRRYNDCRFACFTRLRSGEACPDCEIPMGPLFPHERPTPPQFPCCDDCVGEKCVVATGNEDCIMGGVVKETLLFMAQLLCFQAANDAYNHLVDCWVCYTDEYWNCVDGNRCAEPKCPQATMGEMYPEVFSE